jgi:hypothetical protein
MDTINSVTGEEGKRVCGYTGATGVVFASAAMLGADVLDDRTAARR